MSSHIFIFKITILLLLLLFYSYFPINYFKHLLSQFLIFFLKTASRDRPNKNVRIFELHFITSSLSIWNYFSKYKAHSRRFF